MSIARLRQYLSDLANDVLSFYVGGPKLYSFDELIEAREKLCKFVYIHASEQDAKYVSITLADYFRACEDQGDVKRVYGEKSDSYTRVNAAREKAFEDLQKLTELEWKK